MGFVNFKLPVDNHESQMVLLKVAVSMSVLKETATQ